MTAHAEKPARSMRELMPQTFAWLQDLRAAFGAEAIDPQIRAALQDGMPTFRATEGGHTVGVQRPTVGVEISAAQMVIIKPEKEPAHGRR